MTNHFIYIAPHLDDVVLSCGGLVYEQVQDGKQVEIWTITAGNPQQDMLPPFAQTLHKRWGTDIHAVAQRREEDLQACRILGALPRHLAWKDCIYRFTEKGDALIESSDDLFFGNPEQLLVTEISTYLKGKLPVHAQLVAPISIGHHIDHSLTANAIMESALPAYHYADYPYVSYKPDEAATLDSSAWERIPAVITREGLQAWQDAIGAYSSQLSTFWQNIEEMQLAVANYCAGGGGRLWKHHPAGSTRTCLSVSNRAVWAITAASRIFMISSSSLIMRKSANNRLPSIKSTCGAAVSR